VQGAAAALALSQIHLRAQQPKTGMWYKGRHMCDVTKYADAYATTQGKSPFATRNLAAERPGARAM
jgi:hypothetical protein